MRWATIRTIRLTGLTAILLLNFSALAVAHLGETPDQVKERLGKPTEILGSDGVPVPTPADSAYLYFFPGYILGFYFKEGACGEIRVIHYKTSGTFTMEEVKADFEKATGVASEGCDQTDEDDLKSIVSRDHQCLARTNDPLILFIEDLSFFAYEATAASRSDK
jgi:hypothetical protein